jgi:eukaryotic-like serine/threonine-protein kinase
MSAAAPRIIGRYALYGEIASGGMAAVHLGRLLGPVGFSRTVAVKRLHAQFAKDPEFVAMFLDEARLAARIRHPNVVPTLDVVALDGELFLVLEYVQGDALATLLRETRKSAGGLPLPIASAVMAGALHGLHAAHEAKNERGELLHLVHRDVSPQNILVGVDGVARVLDFGVAKAVGRLRTTREGQLKGKLPYMAPEQFRGNVTRATDVYAAGVVLWEAIVGRRLFQGDEPQVLAGVLGGDIDPPSRWVAAPPELDAVVLCALDRRPENRFANAREMARALERAVPPAALGEVGEWVERAGGAALAKRAEVVSQVENDAWVPAVAAAAATAATVVTEAPTLVKASAFSATPTERWSQQLTPTAVAAVGAVPGAEPATDAQLSSSLLSARQPRSPTDHRRVGVLTLVAVAAGLGLLVLVVRLASGPAQDAAAPRDTASSQVAAASPPPLVESAAVTVAAPSAPSVSAPPQPELPEASAAPADTAPSAPPALPTAQQRRSTPPRSKPPSSGPLRFRTPD